MPVQTIAFPFFLKFMSAVLHYSNYKMQSEISELVSWSQIILFPDRHFVQKK